MDELNRLSIDSRVTVRRSGPPDPAGTCVVYWMQRAQRGLDNPAWKWLFRQRTRWRSLPSYSSRRFRFIRVPTFATTVSSPRHSGHRESLRKRNIGFVLRRFPEHSLTKFCEEIRPSLVVGDENPMREPESWRRSAAKKLSTLSGPLTQMSSCLETAGKSAVRGAHHPAEITGATRALPRPPKIQKQSSVEKAAALQSLDPEFEITQAGP